MSGAAPPKGGAAPPCICSAGAAAASAARVGARIRIGSTAYAAARAAAAPAAASAARRRAADGAGAAAITAIAAAARRRRRTGDRAALLRAGAGTGAGGIRGRGAADRAGRLLTAGIAAPLLDKVREREAAEAAVAGRSHIVSPPENDPGTSVPASFYAACARTVPQRVEKQKKPGRHGAVRELDTKIERNSALGELRRAAGCLQAVLLKSTREKSPIFNDFSIL